MLILPLFFTKSYPSLVTLTSKRSNWSAIVTSGIFTSIPFASSLISSIFLATVLTSTIFIPTKSTFVLVPRSAIDSILSATQIVITARFTGGVTNVTLLLIISNSVVSKKGVESISILTYSSLIIGTAIGRSVYRHHLQKGILLLPSLAPYSFRSRIVFPVIKVRVSATSSQRACMIIEIIPSVAKTSGLPQVFTCISVVSLGS